MILGAIIAGGRASRFGSDKALAEWRGKPLIAWAYDALAPWCNQVFVCGRDWGEMPSLADLPEPGLGPLGGIAAALSHAERRGFSSVLTIGCDMPEVPRHLTATLISAVPAYCPDAPVLGHWPAREATALIARLSGPASRAVRAWAEAIGASAVPAPAGLRNVNTPADLDA